MYDYCILNLIITKVKFRIHSMNRYKIYNLQLQQFFFIHSRESSRHLPTERNATY